ncbi:hypothetical protein BB560_005972 [Smittium megazygosporum]|uniref:Uncharacterized protein n=1 Tax=Smittium megazygosporum TaxID=133381 RepID=A0A2T9YNJ8_9FUNG|nr:hypothetical protein BB560_005972 [Smittium megazygosporum]
MKLYKILLVALLEYNSWATGDCVNDSPGFVLVQPGYYEISENERVIDNPCKDKNTFEVSIFLGGPPSTDIFLRISENTKNAPSINSIFGVYSFLNSLVYSPNFNKPSDDVWLRKPLNITRFGSTTSLRLSYKKDIISIQYLDSGNLMSSTDYNTANWNVTPNYISLSTWFGGLNIGKYSVRCTTECEDVDTASSSAFKPTSSPISSLNPPTDNISKDLLSSLPQTNLESQDTSSALSELPITSTQSVFEGSTSATSDNQETLTPSTPAVSQVLTPTTPTVLEENKSTVLDIDEEGKTSTSAILNISATTVSDNQETLTSSTPDASQVLTPTIPTVLEEIENTVLDIGEEDETSTSAALNISTSTVSDTQVELIFETPSSSGSSMPSDSSALEGIISSLVDSSKGDSYSISTTSELEESSQTEPSLKTTSNTRIDLIGLVSSILASETETEALDLSTSKLTWSTITTTPTTTTLEKSSTSVTPATPGTPSPSKISSQIKTSFNLKDELAATTSFSSTTTVLGTPSPPTAPIITSSTGTANILSPPTNEVTSISETLQGPVRNMVYASNIKLIDLLDSPTIQETTTPSAPLPATSSELVSTSTSTSTVEVTDIPSNFLDKEITTRNDSSSTKSSEIVSSANKNTKYPIPGPTAALGAPPQIQSKLAKNIKVTSAYAAAYSQYKMYILGQTLYSSAYKSYPNLLLTGDEEKLKGLSKAYNDYQNVSNSYIKALNAYKRVASL